jgi:hypothetical protein
MLEVLRLFQKVSVEGEARIHCAHTMDTLVTHTSTGEATSKTLIRVLRGAFNAGLRHSEEVRKDTEWSIRWLSLVKEC